MGEMGKYSIQMSKTNLKSAERLWFTMLDIEGYLEKVYYFSQLGGSSLYPADSWVLQ